MRVRGFALTELLVAVAIAGLIIGVLTFLNVDYVGLSQRIGDGRAPYDLGRQVEAGAAEDLCANPGAMLRAGDGKVVAQSIRASTAALTVDTSDDKLTVLSGPKGLAGMTKQPVRIVVASAPAIGASSASIEIGDATVGVVAPRCDLPEVCDYDATNGLCQADEEKPVAKPS
jgi:prepilin-type N-terminal cleavage/methylation domain-containing protein